MSLTYPVLGDEGQRESDEPALTSAPQPHNNDLVCPVEMYLVMDFLYSYLA